MTGDGDSISWDPEFKTGLRESYLKCFPVHVAPSDSTQVVQKPVLRIKAVSLFCTTNG